MTLVDSLDSVLMLYAYAGPTQDPSISKFALTFKDDKSVLPAEGSSNELVPTLSADPNVPLVAETGEPIEPSAETGPNPKTVSPQSDTVERISMRDILRVSSSEDHGMRDPPQSDEDRKEGEGD
jgi:hypothetical protein